MSPKRIFEWFDGAPRRRTGVRVFQVLIAVAIVIRCMTELPYSAWLFGPQGLGDGAAPATFGPLGAVYGLLFRSTATVVALFMLQLGGALLLLAGRMTRVATATVLFTFLCFEARFPEIADGGDNLIRLCLIYMVLLLPVRATAAPGSARAWAHNLGVALMIGQILIVYFTAGIMKAQGSLWAQGTALYMVSQVEWISLPGLRDMFKLAIVTVPASYLTVAWQISFPIGVFSRFKLGFIALGTFFHLGIGVFMGLVTFSGVMIGAEAFLIDDQEYAALRARARAVLREARGRFRRPNLSPGEVVT